MEETADFLELCTNFNREFFKYNTTFYQKGARGPLCQPLYPPMLNLTLKSVDESHDVHSNIHPGVLEFSAFNLRAQTLHNKKLKRKHFFSNGFNSGVGEVKIVY